jgi:steroid delta-isomerase-like uncharacterized protein
MSAEDNKVKFRRVVEEAWNKGNMAVLREVVAPNYVWHMIPGQEFKGQEGFEQAITMFRTAMPDLNLKIDEVLAEGDRVAALYTLTGTATGEFLGIQPTGKRCTIRGAAFIRYKDDKEVEAVTLADQLSMFQQLGIKPPVQ